MANFKNANKQAPVKGSVAPNGTVGLALEGTAGDDTIHGSDREDALWGKIGNDFLYGGQGNDRLDGGDDQDFLHGGAGADVLNGGGGSDTASYSGSKAVKVDLAQCRGWGGDADGDLLINIEHVQGSLFGDNLTGDDHINILWGEAGNDTLNGGGGHDCLAGGSGRDVLTGGSGHDTFVLMRDGGTDRITDFDTDQDRIELHGYGSNNQYKPDLWQGSYDSSGRIHIDQAGTRGFNVMYIQETGELLGFDFLGQTYMNRPFQMTGKEIIAVLENRPELHASDLSLF